MTDITEQDSENSVKKRKRLTLSEKKDLVNKFKKEKLDNFNLRRLDEENHNKVLSISSFCQTNGIANNVMLSDWLAMDYLGQLEGWEGKNDLSKNVFKESEVGVLKLINEGLSHNEYINICIKSVAEYGAFAAQDIAKKTMIGFYSGIYCGVNDTVSSHKRGITETHIIDAGNFLSCHARYVNNSSSKANGGNVEFKLNEDETNVQKKITLWTTRNIPKNEELLANCYVDYASVQASTFIVKKKKKLNTTKKVTKRKKKTASF